MVGRLLAPFRVSSLRCWSCLLRAIKHELHQGAKGMWLRRCCSISCRLDRGESGGDAGILSFISLAFKAASLVNSIRFGQSMTGSYRRVFPFPPDLDNPRDLHAAFSTLEPESAETVTLSITKVPSSIPLSSLSGTCTP